MPSPSDHLANERTFLAWIRTGIALIGFGFVIAKFALFLEILKGGKVEGASVTYGEVMILMGAAVIVYGIYTFLSNEKDLERNQFRPKATQHVVFAGVILVISIVLALLII